VITKDSVNTEIVPAEGNRYPSACGFIVTVQKLEPSGGIAAGPSAVSLFI
jgi:hypothetical protein